MNDENAHIDSLKDECSIIKSALDRIDSPEPDVDEELKALRHRITHTGNGLRLAKGIAAAIAAIALLLFMIKGIQQVGKYNDKEISLSDSTAHPTRVYTPSSDSNVVKVGENSADGTETASAANELVELKTPVGKDLHATLSDGTTVWLNSGSSLKLYKAFSKSERRVSLSGEAYFEVRHDSSRPFIVEANGMTVVDLGTAFNVEAYSYGRASVTLVKGKVAVNANNRSIELKPGMAATMDNGEMKIHFTDTYPYTQRKEGLFYFHDATLKTIMLEIGRWYGRNVVFENPDNMNLKIHFVDERGKSLQDIISDLNSIDGVQVFAGANDITVR